MSLGGGFGFAFEDARTPEELFGYAYGSFLLEMEEPEVGVPLGTITEERSFVWRGASVSADALDAAYEGRLEGVYPVRETERTRTLENFSSPRTAVTHARVGAVHPKVLIPVFPGTNCEYDTAKVLRDAGADASLFVINNLSSDGIRRSAERFAAQIRESQMIFIPGGFSGGDEPDGSGKFIMAFFRSPQIREEVHRLLTARDGLMCGICNGFQALIKLGLVPYGRIVDPEPDSPTLTFNTIGRHQSQLVRIRIASNRSPWLAATEVGDIFTVPISHGEGRFLASEEMIRSLAHNGQIATQYVDADGNATDDIRFNPNGSVLAVEGITSPDGRVFGKMGHSERIGRGLYKNVPGAYDMQMFASAVRYFR